MGYNFGCVIASGTIFDSKEWVFRIALSDEDIADFEVGMSPWQPILELKLL